MKMKQIPDQTKIQYFDFLFDALNDLTVTSDNEITEDNRSAQFTNSLNNAIDIIEQVSLEALKFTNKDDSIGNIDF